MPRLIDGERGDKIIKMAAEGKTFAEIRSSVMAEPESIKAFIKRNNLNVTFVKRQKTEVFR